MSRTAKCGNRGPHVAESQSYRKVTLYEVAQECGVKYQGDCRCQGCAIESVERNQQEIEQNVCSESHDDYHRVHARIAGLGQNAAEGNIPGLDDHTGHEDSKGHAAGEIIGVPDEVL